MATATEELEEVEASEETQVETTEQEPAVIPGTARSCRTFANTR